MAVPPAVLAKIHDAIQLSRIHGSVTDLYLVANTKSGTKPLYEYPGYSIATDFFSDEEFSDLLSAFRTFVGYVEGVVGEEAFIDRAIKGKIARADRRTLVYSGIGASPGRASSILVPALCEYLGMTTCVADSCALALMDNKFHAFQIIREFGGNIPRQWLYEPSAGWLMGHKPPLGMMVIAKPNNGAASIGVSSSSVREFGPEMDEFVATMSRDFGDPFIVQEFVNGYEVEVPILDLGHPLAPLSCGITLNNDRRLGSRILDYETVYDDQYTFYDFAEENRGLAELCQRHSENAYRVLGLSGIARIDFRIGGDGIPYVTDVTGLPHLTPFSSPSFMFETMGFGHVDLMHVLLAVGHRRL